MSHTACNGVVAELGKKRIRPTAVSDAASASVAASLPLRGPLISALRAPSVPSPSSGALPVSSLAPHSYTVAQQASGDLPVNHPSVDAQHHAKRPSLQCRKGSALPDPSPFVLPVLVQGPDSVTTYPNEQPFLPDDSLVNHDTLIKKSTASQPQPLTNFVPCTATVRSDGPTMEVHSFPSPENTSIPSIVNRDRRMMASRRAPLTARSRDLPLSQLAAASRPKPATSKSLRRPTVNGRSSASSRRRDALPRRDTTCVQPQSGVISASTRTTVTLKRSKEDVRLFFPPREPLSVLSSRDADDPLAFRALKKPALKQQSLKDTFLRLGSSATVTSAYQLALPTESIVARGSSLSSSVNEPHDDKHCADVSILASDEQAPCAHQCPPSSFLDANEDVRSFPARTSGCDSSVSDTNANPLPECEGHVAAFTLSEPSASPNCLTNAREASRVPSRIVTRAQAERLRQNVLPSSNNIPSASASRLEHCGIQRINCASNSDSTSNKPREEPGKNSVDGSNISEEKSDDVKPPPRSEHSTTTVIGLGASHSADTQCKPLLTSRANSYNDISSTNCVPLRRGVRRTRSVSVIQRSTSLSSTDDAAAARRRKSSTGVRTTSRISSVWNEEIGSRGDRSHYMGLFLCKNIQDANALVGCANYFKYFKKCEYSQRVSAASRRAIVQFIVDVGRGVATPISNFSIHMAINLFDRYMSQVGRSSKTELRERAAKDIAVIGAACLYICSKMEDSWCLSLGDICKVFDGGSERRRNDVLRWEVEISREFNFMFYSPTILDFIYKMVDLASPFLLHGGEQGDNATLVLTPDNSAVSSECGATPSLLLTSDNSSTGSTGLGSVNIQQASQRQWDARSVPYVAGTGSRGLSSPQYFLRSGVKVGDRLWATETASVAEINEHLAAEALSIGEMSLMHHTTIGTPVHLIAAAALLVAITHRFEKQRRIDNLPQSVRAFLGKDRRRLARVATLVAAIVDEHTVLGQKTSCTLNASLLSKKLASCPSVNKGNDPADIVDDHGEDVDTAVVIHSPHHAVSSLQDSNQKSTQN